MEQPRTGFSRRSSWLLGLGIALVVVALPLLRYRWVYEENRRLRIVDPDKLYRSGRLTANGLENAIRQYKIKTVINLMDEETAPQLPASFFDGSRVSEIDICNRNGAKYVFLETDLIPRSQASHSRPKAIDQFLEIMANPDNHPVLLHCRAGLHRTGVLTAVYRMHFDGWSGSRAWHELRENGFGEFNCFINNDYIQQYIFNFARTGKRLDADAVPSDGGAALGKSGQLDRAQ